MRHTIPLLLVLTFLATSAAHAGSGGGHNMAGCGWGEQLFKDNKNTAGVQSTAVTTNGTFANQLFGITSGTAGCSSAGLMARRDRATFIATNYRSLSRELSAGQGEYAASLAAVMGCRGEAVPAFLTLTRQHYDTLFPNDGATPQKTLDALEAVITTDAALARTCTL